MRCLQFVIAIDKNLNFNSHLSILCKKAGQKVTALARIAKLLPFHKRRIILKSFIESKFSHCPLVWMFCSRQMDRKINRIHEKALRLVYDDYTSSFNELLKHDKTISIYHRNIHCVAIEMFKAKNHLSLIVWNNMLPERLKVCSSLSEFKNAIKSWIHENCTCRLCKHYVQGLGFIKQ